MLIYGSTLVMNIDNFIRPRLVSGRTKVHPVLILIGVLGGLRMFGFIGMLIGPARACPARGIDQILGSRLLERRKTGDSEQFLGRRLTD